MIIDKSFSQKIESCIKQSHLNVVNEAKSRGAKVDSLTIGSGAACFLGSQSFLSQVIAWGFAEGALEFEAELKKMEDFYQGCQFSEVNIELSPLCGPDVVSLLAEEGCCVTEVNNISVLDLQNYTQPPLANEVVQTPVSDLSEWARVIAEGFSLPKENEQFELYAASSDIIAFHCLGDGVMAAGGTVAIHGDICDLGVTSTLPASRGKGMQKALLHARLGYAKGRGVRYACVTTEPGSVSDINIQKIGFQIAYTRLKFSKRLGDL